MNIVNHHPISFIGGVFHGCYTEEHFLPIECIESIYPDSYILKQIFNPCTGREEYYFICDGWSDSEVESALLELFFPRAA